MSILSDSSNTYLTKSNFIHTLPNVLFDRSVKTYSKTFNNMSLTVLIAEWLERHAAKQGVAGPIPGRGVYIFAYFLLLTAWRRPYK